MNETICFIGDGVNDVWTLPYSPQGELVVSVISTGGLERQLLQGRDYQLLGDKLVIPLALGDHLLVRPASGGQSGQGARHSLAFAAAQAQATAAPQYADGNAASEAELGEALERRYQELSSRLRLGMEQEAASLAQELAAKLKSEIERGLVQLSQAARKGRDEARLATSPLPSRSRLVLPTGCRAGAYLTIESAYLPGTGALQLYIDGRLAAPDVDYEECGPQNEASNTIRSLKELAQGVCLDCLVSSISSSDTARLAAEAAQKAQAAAAVMLTDAQARQAQLETDRALAMEDTALAQGWAEAAQSSADKAYEAAVHAFDLAAQISLYRREPGICAVKDKSDIHACSPGLFVINKHLTHAPTPFFGVWPAQCLDDMLWDGVFFLGGKCYPPDPALPPKRPPKPAPKPLASGGSDEWLPCDHSHGSPPRPGCACIAWPPKPKPGCDCESREE